ncbi:hypothetical protein [Nitrospira sp.]|uniref:hypothetical protein n=1 Tax=Nitrospira sp. TaxID=70125 RepID=UPI003FCE62CE
MSVTESDIFRNEKGGGGIEDEDDLRKQDAFAEWGLNIINCFIQVEDKRILDLRCQTGALSARLRSAGRYSPWSRSMNEWFKCGGNFLT